MDKLTRETLDYFLLSADTESLRRVWIQGDLFRLICPSSHNPPPPCERKRTIKEFSAEARKRALEFEATIDWERTKACMWCQMGYPDDCLPKDKDDLKKHRFLFHRHVERFYNRHIWGVWRVEWEPRKTGLYVGYKIPHWHILLADVGDTPYKEFHRMWRDTIHPPTKRRAWFKRLYDAKGKALYSAKYCAKSSDEVNLGCLAKWNSTGKHHGYFREELIPRCKKFLSRQLTWQETEKLVRIAREIVYKLPPGKFSAFTAFRSKWKPLLDEMAKMGLPVPAGVA